MYASAIYYGSIPFCEFSTHKKIQNIWYVLAYFYIHLPVINILAGQFCLKLSLDWKIKWSSSSSEVNSQAIGWIQFYLCLKLIALPFQLTA
jgi:hypothetical protein